MKPGLVLVTAFFAACAAPDASSVLGTAKGAKGPDLGNFVESDDLSSSSDLAVPSLDLGVSLDQSVQVVVADLSIAHDLSTPHDMAMSSGCGSVTYAGSCKNNTLTYCYQSKVQTITCTNGMQCTTVSGDSNCRYVNGSACGPIDSNGVCDGDTLAYCSGSTLSVTDCSASGLSCVVSSGFADCN